MRMINRGIEPEAFNRAQRSERASQQRAGKDGMQDLGNAYKRKGSAAAPPDDDEEEDGNVPAKK